MGFVRMISEAAAGARQAFHAGRVAEIGGFARPRATLACGFEGKLMEILYDLGYAWFFLDLDSTWVLGLGIDHKLSRVAARSSEAVPGHSK